MATAEKRPGPNARRPSHAYLRTCEDVIDDERDLVAHQDLHAAKNVKLARGDEAVERAAIGPFRDQQVGSRVGMLGDDAAGEASVELARALEERARRGEKLGFVFRLDVAGQPS